MRKIISFMLAAVMVFSLEACGSSGTTDTSSSKDTSLQTAATSEPEESIPENITLTTYNGAGELIEAEFPYDTQRIAAMDLAALDILDNIGFGGWVVGVSKGSSIDYLQDYVTNDELYNLGTIKEAAEVLDNELVNKTDAAQNGRVVVLEHSNVWYTAEGGITALGIMLSDLENALLK